MLGPLGTVLGPFRSPSERQKPEPQKPDPQKPIKRRLGPRERAPSESRPIHEDLALETALRQRLEGKVAEQMTGAEDWEALQRLVAGEMPEREDLEHYAQALGR